MGHEVLEGVNAPVRDGAGFMDFNIKDGRRFSVLSTANCSLRLNGRSALYPIIGHMEPRLAVQDAGLFAEMLSIPNDERYPALELTP